MLRLDRLAALLELQAVASAPFVDLLPPGLQRLLVKLQLARLPGREQIPSTEPATPTDRRSNNTVLVIEGGSVVEWIFLESGEELSRRPVAPVAEGGPQFVLK